MGDKQELLAAAVPDMIARLVSPNCVDAQGRYVAPSKNGQCASGHLEFKPVHDMHIGVVSSSLGGRGGDACGPDAKNPANANLNAHNDDHGHLINRGGADEHAVLDAVPASFLAWFPPVARKCVPVLKLRGRLPARAVFRAREPGLRWTGSSSSERGSTI